MGKVNEAAFLAKKKPDWDRLTLLCLRADVSTSQLRQEEYRELVQLYRSASNDLALLRTHSTNLGLIEYLNGLVGSAYVTLYRPNPRPLREGFKSVLYGFAQAVVRRRLFVGLSAATALAAALFAWLCLDFVPDSRPFLVDQNIEHWKQGRFDPRTGGESAAMTAFYASNNPRVSLVVAGIASTTFGFGAFYVDWQTGMQLGTLGHELASVGRFKDLFTVAPHGVTEIQGLLLVCGGGFLLGWSLISPGRKRRLDSLRDAMQDGMYLFLGGIGLMYLAAPMEGFFSFDPRIPLEVKLFVAAVILMAWLLFYRHFGKQPEKVGTLEA